MNSLQQCLPFTVLKQSVTHLFDEFFKVATVLTVYGIETIITKPFLHKFFSCNSAYRLRYWNNQNNKKYFATCKVATVLTVYGIETDYVYL